MQTGSHLECGTLFIQFIQVQKYTLSQRDSIQLTRAQYRRSLVYLIFAQPILLSHTIGVFVSTMMHTQAAAAHIGKNFIL
jgi:hypothetical protein